MALWKDIDPSNMGSRCSVRPQAQCCDCEQEKDQYVQCIQQHDGLIPIGREH